MAEAPAGLIHAKVLDGRGGARDAAWDAVRAWTPDDGALWLHFDFEEPEARRWLTEDSGLNDIASSALVTEETRPRTVTRGDNLLLALRGVNLNPGSEPDDMVSVRLWTDGRRILSTRRRRLQSTRDLLDELDAGTGPRSAVDLLVAWIDRITWRMSGTVDNLEEQMDALEQDVLADRVSGMRLALAQLRKQCLSLRRYLAPQREAMNRLCAEPISWIDELNRLRLREINDRLIRHIEDIDTVRERAAVAQEELMTQVSEAMNRRAYVFTVVATIFLPLGFFTGLMGINVGGMPGVEAQLGFWFVVALCVVIAVILALLFRFNRWL